LPLRQIRIQSLAALFRRQENHARKLEYGGDKLEDNPSEESTPFSQF
jgi:hypothetical protein